MKIMVGTKYEVLNRLQRSETPQNIFTRRFHAEVANRLGEQHLTPEQAHSIFIQEIEALARYSNNGLWAVLGWAPELLKAIVPEQRQLHEILRVHNKYLKETPAMR